MGQKVITPVWYGKALTNLNMNEFNLNGANSVAGSIATFTSGNYQNMQASIIDTSFITFDTQLSGASLDTAAYSGYFVIGSYSVCPYISGGDISCGSITANNVGFDSVVASGVTALNGFTCSGTSTFNDSAAFNSGVTFNAGQVVNRTTTSNLTYTTSSADYYIGYTNTSGCIVTLGSVPMESGREYVIKDEGGNASGTNAIVIIPQAGSINGTGSFTTTTSSESVRIICGSPNWFTW